LKNVRRIGFLNEIVKCCSSLLGHGHVHTKQADIQTYKQIGRVSNPCLYSSTKKSNKKTDQQTDIKIDIQTDSVCQYQKQF
jgi:hypothetical protein